MLSCWLLPFCFFYTFLNSIRFPKSISISTSILRNEWKLMKLWSSTHLMCSSTFKSLKKNSRFISYVMFFFVKNKKIKKTKFVSFLFNWSGPLLFRFFFDFPHLWHRPTHSGYIVKDEINDEWNEHSFTDLR